MFAAFHKRLSSFRCDGLYLRSAEEPRLVDRPIAFAAVDQITAEKRRAAMDDLITSFTPSVPCGRFLSDPRCGLGGCNTLRVDRFGLGADPCPVQGFGKADSAFAEDAPCPVHDRLQIVLHGVYLLFFVRLSGCQACLYRLSRLFFSQEPTRLLIFFRAVIPVPWGLRLGAGGLRCRGPYASWWAAAYPVKRFYALACASGNLFSLGTIIV